MITIFTSEFCGQCPMVKKYLSYKNIQYKEVSIETPDGREAYNKLSGGRT